VASADVIEAVRDLSFENVRANGRTVNERITR
jgi:hypothetical protein